MTNLDESNLEIRGPEHYKKNTIIRVRKVEYSGKAKGFLKSVSFPIVSTWDYTWIIGYRKLLRYVRVEYDMSRNVFETLCYFAGGKDNELATDILQGVFGFKKRAWYPWVLSLVERGYLEKVVCRADKYRVLPNGMDLLRRCEKFWKLEIAR